MEDEKLGRAGIVATQVLCGAAVVAGLKSVPALWNLHLITQPVQTLQIALVFCFLCFFFFLLSFLVREIPVPAVASF
jgi:hypothetical protein